MRQLWSYTSDSTVSKACDGVTFSSKPKTAADAMMDSIMSQRRADKPLAKLTNDSDYGSYIMSLAQYTIPWAVFFVLSIIGL